MAGADRFTVFGGIWAALRAVVRRPVSLILALAANIVLTAALAWLDKAALEQATLGRLVAQLAYIGIDATFGLWVMLLIAGAFEPGRPTVRDTLSRLRWALAPAIVVNLIDGAPSNLAEILIGEPSGDETWFPLLFLGILTGHFIVAIGVGCTVAFAPFVAFTRPMKIATALEESLALTAGWRWRLGVFAFLLTIAGLVVSFLTPPTTTPVQAAVSQAIYTCYYVAGVILLAGMGLALTRATLGRQRSLAAEFD